jgi:predicted DNA-binding transcriptional regulator AlpA
MGRKLTFPQLKTEKGWPYSRQHTHKLVAAGRFPRPDKLYEGGLLNVWDEEVVDAHLAKRKFESSASPEAA